VVIPVSS